MEKTTKTESKNPKLFIKVPLWLFEVDISSSARLLWGRLQFYQGKNQEGFSKRKTLSKELHFDPSYITRLLKELKDCGLLEITSKRGQSLRYRVKQSSGQVSTAFHSKSGGHKSTRVVDKSPQEQWTSVHRGSGQKSTTFIEETQSNPLKTTQNVEQNENGKEALKEVLKEALKEEGDLSPFEDRSQPQITEEGLKEKKWKGHKGVSGYEDPLKGWPLDIPHICPVCQGRMVMRTNSQTGERFSGCVNWPKCPGPKKKKIPRHIQAINNAPWTQEWLKNQLPDD